jgi:hypothetical protein
MLYRRPELPDLLPDPPLDASGGHAPEPGSSLRDSTMPLTGATFWYAIWYLDGRVCWTQALPVLVLVLCLLLAILLAAGTIIFFAMAVPERWAQWLVPVVPLAVLVAAVRGVVDGAPWARWALLAAWPGLVAAMTWLHAFAYHHRQEFFVGAIAHGFGHIDPIAAPPHVLLNSLVGLAVLAVLAFVLLRKWHVPGAAPPLL